MSSSTKLVPVRFTQGTDKIQDVLGARKTIPTAWPSLVTAWPGLAWSGRKREWGAP